MSEKRFEFYSDDKIIGVLDTVTGRTFNSFEIVDKLNEQQEQIEQLHLAIDDLLSHTSCDEIKKENEQLRNELNDCEKFRYTVFKLMNELNDE